MLLDSDPSISMVTSSSDAESSTRLFEVVIPETIEEKNTICGRLSHSSMVTILNDQSTKDENVVREVAAAYCHS